MHGCRRGDLLVMLHLQSRSRNRGGAIKPQSPQNQFLLPQGSTAFPNSAISAEPLGEFSHLNHNSTYSVVFCYCSQAKAAMSTFYEEICTFLTYLLRQTFPKRLAFVSPLEKAISVIKHLPWGTVSRNMESMRDAWRAPISALRTHTTMMLPYNNHPETFLLTSWWSLWSWRKACRVWQKMLKDTCPLFFHLSVSGVCPSTCPGSEWKSPLLHDPSCIAQ